MKEVSYHIPGVMREPSRVAYHMSGLNCYFTATEKMTTSTINGAEYVIQAIADNERKRPSALRFFDIQTHKGYFKRPGVYAVDELEFKVKWDNSVGKIFPIVSAWKKTSLPTEIIEVFKKFIG